MKLDFKKGNGLIPAIIQDYQTGQVLMVAFMNEEAFKKTQETKNVWFFSRSKNRLWMKGETSCDKLMVNEIFIDCDKDTILIKAKMLGKAVCHTGKISCFFEKIV